jgi:DNA-binding NarL/FixJ family response regulator
VERLLIVDDHPGFRAAARRLLSSEGVTVVGEAEDVASARKLVADLEPSLVLIDVQLPDGNGIDLAQDLLRLVPAPKVIVVSSRDRAEYAERLEEATLPFIGKADLTVGKVLSNAS